MKNKIKDVVIQGALGSKGLSLRDVVSVAKEEAKVVLSSTAAKKVIASRKYLESEIKNGKTIYGVNTGFGNLANIRVSDKELSALQVNLLRSHAVGTGAPLPDAFVRAMMVLRASQLAIGHSGVRVEVIEKIVECLNKKVHPIIPEQGSVGASGDLAPLAHLALVLIGEGKAKLNGQVLKGADALKAAKIEPLVLGPKEGLALINGTQFMTGIGVLVLHDAEYLCEIADLAGAMSVEAMRGTASPFDARIHQLRAHPGQIKCAENLRGILMPGGKPSAIARSHSNCSKVQDPYSLRCMPQVHGAVRDTLDFVRSVLEREVNAVTDNPLVFPAGATKGGAVLSGGNFHGEVIAMALDYLAIALSELASISQERIAKLVNPVISELPAFLIKNGGVNSGFMIVQVAAAAIVSENKTLAHPASVDSIPTSADKEDHVSMGAWAARKANLVLQNVRRVLAMELLAAAQGLDFLAPLKSTPLIEREKKKIRTMTPFSEVDLEWSPEIEKIEQAIVTERFSIQH